jgi:hypothetical protein
LGIAVRADKSETVRPGNDLALKWIAHVLPLNS